MSTTDQLVNDVLKELDDIKSEVQSRKQILQDFLDELTTSIENNPECNLLQGVYFRYPGSAYEKVAVTDRTDFDIAMVLPAPFIGDNFKRVKTRHGAGFYKLKWSNDDEDQPDLVDHNGFLKTIDLRDKIFEQLNEVLDDIKNEVGDITIRNRNCNASMLVIINEGNTKESIKVDLVPQIHVTRWSATPDPPSNTVLPSVLREYVNQTRYPMFYSLATPLKSPKVIDSYALPRKLNNASDKHLLVSCSFSELEKYCLKKSDAVCNAVRLVKLVSINDEWKKKFNLHSYHIKRVAIKHYDTLDKLSNWAAFQKLLSYLAENLDDWLIDGFFIKDQNIYNEDGLRCQELAKEIQEAKKSINPYNLKELLEDDD